MKQEDINIAVQQIKQGDAKAFERIYDAYSSALFGICLKIVKDEEASEDILQDAFVKIWKKIYSFDETKGTLFTWMLNITRNTAIDRYRQLVKKSEVSIQNEDSNVSYSKASSSTMNVNHIGLSELLKTLPDEQQVIIEYLYFKGYTQQEVAEELDLPLGTVKTRSRSALKAMKELFILLLTWI